MSATQHLFPFVSFDEYISSEDVSAKMKGFMIDVVGFSDDKVTNAFQTLFSKAGFEVKLFQTADEAFQDFEKSSADAFIIHCESPPSLQSALHFIRKTDAHIPVIVLVQQQQQQQQQVNELISKTTWSSPNTSPATLPQSSSPFNSISSNPKSQEFHPTSDETDTSSSSLFTTHFKLPIHPKALLTELDNKLSLYLNYCKSVNMKQAAEMCGDEGFVVELLGDFCESTVPSLQKLKKGLEEKNYDTITSEAHSIKGAAAQLCAKPLAQAAYLLEKHAKQGLPIDDTAMQTYQLLEKRFDELKEYTCLLNK